MAERLVWIDADGAAWDLDANGVEWNWGHAGLHGTKHRVARRTVAGQAGTLLDRVEDDWRDFSLAVTFLAPTEAEFREFVNDWAYRFDPTRQPAGRSNLLFYRDDGSVRAIRCVCVDGFRFAETEDSRGGDGTISTVLEFEADDPYWYQVFPTTKQWAGGSNADALWFDPLGLPPKYWLPIILGASQVTGGPTTFDVPSHKPVFPIWTVRGPAAVITFTHAETGRVLEWDSAAASVGALTATDRLVFDLRDRNDFGRPAKTVIHYDTPSVGGTATNAFDGLTSFEMWPLLPGANTVTIEVSGVDATTNVTASWFNRYRGP